MRSQKAFLFAAVVLIIASIANAGLSLTVNGLDATKPLEIEDKEDLIIAVAGESDVKAQDISVTCYIGKLEPLSEPNTLAKKPTSGKYLFHFTDKTGLGIVSLKTHGDLVYQLVLFYIPETNTTIAFGLDSDALAPPQPKSEPEPEQQVSASQTTSSAMDGSGIFYASGASDSNDVLDPNWYPNLNADQSVNFEDFAIFGTNWQQSGSGLDGDFDNSGTVDFNDMAILAYYWLANTTGPSPEEVFESFKTALLADDVDQALTFFTETAAESYADLLEQLRPYFQQMVNDMGEVVLISLDNNTAVYDVLREENGDTYGYPVLFGRDEMGQWKIYDF